jgi:predicted O-linked N-acetylglucosamine transferase (SPINDLY family)
MHNKDERIAKALELIKLKEYVAAEQIYRSLISEKIYDPRVFCNLAILCGMNGRRDERISLLEMALSLDPNNARVCSDLGVAYQEQGEIKKAISFYQSALKKDPNMPEIHNNIGLALLLNGDHDSAIYSLRKAIALNSEYVEPFINLGKLYAETGKYSLAAEAYRQCVALQPEISAHLFELGLAEHNNGELEKAIESYLELLKLEPQHPGGLLNLGIILAELGRADEAVFYFLSVLAIDADNIDALINYGRALYVMGYYDESFSVLNKAHELDPLNTDILNRLGLCLQITGLISDAIKMFEKALIICPQQPVILANLAVSLRSHGDLISSISTFKQAIAADPDRHDFYKGLLFAYACASENYAWENLELAGSYWQKVKEQQISSIDLSHNITAPITMSVSNTSKIRVGILCADLGHHVVSTFLLPFLKDYDRNTFHVELISVQRRYEDHASVLINCADAWYSLQGLDVKGSREKMKSRDYHIIIETNGFTRDTGIELLAERCALVQCHYIGYHASIGLDTIDYFIGDEETLPKEFEWQFSEKLWRLPRTWLACCPYHDYPPANHVVQKDIPVLGSFNQLAKINEETMIFWSATMKRLPKSVLLIKDKQCSDNNACDRIRNFMREHSIVSERLLFLPTTPNWNDHLMHYNLVDVALDATPWSSATTAFDALGMGVPLVAIRGECMSARMSSSIVKAIGKESWVASTPYAYSTIVAELCEDLDALRLTRGERQRKFLASKLFDIADMATCLQDAFVSMLRNAKTE